MQPFFRYHVSKVKNDSSLSIRHFFFQIVEAGDFVEESMVENVEEDGVEDAHENVMSAMEIGVPHNVEESMMEDTKTATAKEEGEEEHNAAMNAIEMGSCTAHDDANDESMVVKNLETATADEEQVRNAVESHVDTGAPGYVKLRTASGKRTVANCCAVCLCTYNEGETIVWSSNGKCKHAFHNECVVEWLIERQNGTPCPCCRQEFTDLNRIQ